MNDISLYTRYLEKWEHRDFSEMSENIITCKIVDMLQDICNQENDTIEVTQLKYFLNYSRKVNFLKSLGDDEYRNRWVELVFKIIRKVEFSLLDIMKQRVDEHPTRVLFQDMTNGIPVKWTYDQIFRHVEEIAAVLYSLTSTSPRVALFTQNSVESACCDLACLFFDIFDSPLSTHSSKDVLIYVFETLKINIVITDSKERLKILTEIKNTVAIDFKIVVLSSDLVSSDQIIFLNQRCKLLDITSMEKTIYERTRKPINQVATTMFTSGSTGLPKGVSFSIYNLVSKRFARAAALPQVGDNDVLLCYLPLFHTFGRYLEMLGTIFWGGTYVMVGNSSKETLLALFPQINPSVFISVPLRWQELFEKCVNETENIDNTDLREKIIRQIIGNRLHFGLSAAGYLDPKVFRYFQSFGVELCSGFGMTEATGGITMTPPKFYEDGTVGKALPGIKTRIKENGELELSGHYIGKYLEHASPCDLIPYPENSDNDYWLSTGDVFIESENGYFSIIDRVKDIYKNNKGQTVAPRIVEQKFEGVPGIKRTFLVGDGMPYNVLLIVPDKKTDLLQSFSEENQNEYFHQIVMAANRDLALYERVVNFSVLDDDFSLEKNEITPKGSYNRKQIEKNFNTLITSLYKSNFVEIVVNDYKVIIPRWFFRDLGILENDIYFTDNTLINKRSNSVLVIQPLEDDKCIIGNFIYFFRNKTIDLGLFTRQPKLWIGNPQLIEFCPVKDGWDIPLKNNSERIQIATNLLKTEIRVFPVIKGIKDSRLTAINQLMYKVLFSDKQSVLQSLQEISDLFRKSEPGFAEVIRRRLESLGCSADEEIRVNAYRILLMYDPNPEHTRYPTFLESGLSFLNEASISLIAESNFDKQHLESLRKRLYAYRTQLTWPADSNTRKQFEGILKLLLNFGCSHPQYFIPIRAELSCWILHKSDIQLSRLAEKYLQELRQVFENNLNKTAKTLDNDFWDSVLVFEESFSKSEINRIEAIFKTTSYLQQSIILTYGEYDFSINDIKNQGIWITRLHAFKEFKHYRVSINMKTEKHYDLHIVISGSEDISVHPETMYWLSAIGGYPFDIPIVPQLGCSKPELGIISTSYIDGLTVRDKIRELSDIHKAAGEIYKKDFWRKLFVKALSVFFKSLKHSEFKIVPGQIAPGNVVVSELDFRENATIITLTGWKNYRNSLSMIIPMVNEFFKKTTALYPYTKNYLQISWIFDACIEVFGKDSAYNFFAKLLLDLTNIDFEYEGIALSKHLSDYMNKMENRFYIPLACYNAVDRYHEWAVMNPDATPKAKEHTLFELIELYKLYKYPEFVRYFLFRKTYFYNAEQQIQQAFDRLLSKMESDIKQPPIQLIELSDLQSVVRNKADKFVFGKIVFPRLRSEQKLDIIKIGDNQQEHIIVKSEIKDKFGACYFVREPIEASEVGQLYQLYYKENYPKEISISDKHLIINDITGRLIGGISYKFIEDDTVLLDGTAIISSLQSRGIGSAMIDDFFVRMASLGVKIIKAHFLFGNYYLKHNFKVDKNWGALVKFI